MALPILLVAFNRPQLTLKLLEQVELLDKREIFISIDGINTMTNHQGKRYYETQSNIKEWMSKTKHDVKFRSMKENLGCNQHTVSAMKWFTSFHESGLLVEDDLEFQTSFLKFLDSIKLDEIHGMYDSICSTNSNWTLDILRKPPLTKVEFFESVIFSQTWGMTFSKASTDRLISFQQKMFIEKVQIRKAIRKWSRQASGNFLLKLQLEKYWLGKFDRALTTWDKSRNGYDKNQEVGWDTIYQLAAIYFERKFLLPNWNVGRTSLDANEGAWHEWIAPYERWQTIHLNLEFLLDVKNIQYFPKELNSLRFSKRKFPFRSIVGRNVSY